MLAAIFPEKHPPQHRRDVHWGGVERDILCGLTGALDPVDIIACTLLEENCDPFARLRNPSSHLLQFRLKKFVFCLAHDFDNALLERSQSPGDSVFDEIGLTNPIFAAFFELGPFFDRIEKAVGFFD